MPLQIAHGGQSSAFSRFNVEACLRNIEGITPDIKFGFNPAVGTTTEMVHSLGGDIVFPTAPEPVRVKAGGDVEDDSTGDGARSVIVIGIDADLNYAQETIATNGVNASAATTTSFWRVFRAYVETVGTYTGANIDAVVIENVSSLQELIEIQPLVGQSQTSAMATAIRRSIAITGLTIAVESTKTVEASLCIRENFTQVSAPFTGARVRLAQIKSPEGTWDLPLDAPIFVPELSDIWVTAKVPITAAEVGSLMNYYVAPTPTLIDVSVSTF